MSGHCDGDELLSTRSRIILNIYDRCGQLASEKLPAPAGLKGRMSNWLLNLIRGYENTSRVQEMSPSGLNGSGWCLCVPQGFPVWPNLIPKSGISIRWMEEIAAGSDLVKSCRQLRAKPEIVHLSHRFAILVPTAFSLKPPGNFLSGRKLPWRSPFHLQGKAIWWPVRSPGYRPRV